MKPVARCLVWLAPIAVAACAAGVAIGSVTIAPSALLDVLSGGGEPLHRTLLFDLRLPRALSAFAGALVSTVIVFGTAHGTGSWTPTRLLLTGVVVAAGWGALISFLLAVSPARELPGMLFWLMGDMTNAGSPWAPLAMLAVAAAAALPFGRHLNLLARGPQQAAALGLPVRRMEWGVYLAAALITAVAVTVAGSVGFVGLIIPHMLRLLIGFDQRIILPASALAGGTLLVLADTLARTIIAPEQLPVGVITAMLGVPIFLWLLHRSASS